MPDGLCAPSASADGPSTSPPLVARLGHFTSPTDKSRGGTEYNIKPHPVGEKIFKNPVPVVDGCMAVPEGPGLGVEIDEGMVKKLAG